MTQVYFCKKANWRYLLLLLSFPSIKGLNAQGLRLIESFNYESGVYIAAQKSFYAAATSDGPFQNYFNRLVKVDPIWGTVQAEYYPGLDPRFLRATSDQSALFMLVDRPARVKRFNVLTQTIDQDDALELPVDDLVLNLFAVPKSNDRVIILAFHDGTYYLQIFERGKPKQVYHKLLPGEADFMSTVTTNDSTFWTISPSSGNIKRFKIRQNGLYLEKTFSGYGNYLLQNNFILLGDYFVSENGQYIRHTGEVPTIEGRLRFNNDTKISSPPGSSFFYAIEQAAGSSLSIIKYQIANFKPVDTLPLFVFNRSEGTKRFTACADNLFVFNNNNNVGMFYNCTPKYGKPVIAAPSPLNLCTSPNPERVLTTVQPAFKYYWTKGISLPVESSTFKVTEANTYRVRVSDETGCLTPLSDPLEVRLLYPPGKPTIYSNFPTATPIQFCKGQNLELTISSNPFNQIEWSTGDSINTISITKSGSYRARWHSKGACQGDWSDPIEIVQVADTVPAQPILKVLNAPSGIICIGDTLIYEAPPGYKYYDWNYVITTNSNRFKTPTASWNTQASLWVRVGNQKFCMSVPSELAIVKTIFPSPKPILQRSSNVLISSNTNPNALYEWYLNGSLLADESKRLLVAKKEGFYSVRVRTGDCISAPSDLLAFTGLLTNNQSILEAGTPIVFPNPANEKIYVQHLATDDPNLQIRILDMQGRQLPVPKLNRDQELLGIDIGNLAPGGYVLKGYSSKKSWALHFIKI
jgi:hypothetical protein